MIPYLLFTMSTLLLAWIGFLGWRMYRLMRELTPTPDDVAESKEIMEQMRQYLEDSKIDAAIIRHKKRQVVTRGKDGA